MVFNHCDTYIEAKVTTGSGLAQHPSQFSFETWVRSADDLTDNIPSNPQTVFMKEGYYKLEIIPNSNTTLGVKFTLYFEDGNSEIIEYNNIWSYDKAQDINTAWEWRYLSATYDGQQLNLYVGKKNTIDELIIHKVKTHSITGTPKVGHLGDEISSVYMGSNSDQSQYAHLILDDLRLYHYNIDEKISDAGNCRLEYAPSTCADVIPNLIHQYCNYEKSGRIELITASEAQYTYDWDVSLKDNTIDKSTYFTVMDDIYVKEGFAKSDFVSVTVTDKGENILYTWQIEYPLLWHTNQTPLNTFISTRDFAYIEEKEISTSDKNSTYYEKEEVSYEYPMRFITTSKVGERTWKDTPVASKHVLHTQDTGHISFIIGRYPSDDEYIIGFSSIAQSLIHPHKDTRPEFSFSMESSHGILRLYQSNKLLPYCGITRLFPGDYLQIKRTESAIEYYRNGERLAFVSICCLPDMRIYTAIKKGYIYAPATSCIPDSHVFIEEQGKGVHQVLSASATTFLNSFPSDEGNVILSQISDGNKRAFLKEQQRNIWRTEGQYSFVTARSYTNSGSVIPKLETDGTFPMVLFNHAQPNERHSQWYKVNTVMEYNAHHNPVGSKDISEHYASVLYGFNGQLSIAVATNAVSHEIGFEDFEQYEASIEHAGIENNLDFYVPKTITRQIQKHYTITGTKSSTDFYGLFIHGNHPAGVKGNLLLHEQDEPESFISAKFISPIQAKIHPQTSFTTIPIHFQTVANRTLICYPTQELYQKTANIPKDKTDKIIHGRFEQPIMVKSMNALSPLSNTIAHTGKKSLQGNQTITHQRLKLYKDKKYVMSAWVYGGGSIMMNNNPNQVFHSSGPMIEGWQRVEGVFEVSGTEVTSSDITQFGELYSPTTTLTGAYWDDIRIYPATANITTYVYDVETYRLQAVLDENNYATLYYYDETGQLYLTKKETIQGIQTIQTVMSNQKH